MLYQLAHVLRDRCRWLWDLAEDVNSLAFRLRYCRALNRVQNILSRYPEIRVVEENDAEPLAVFFASQAEEDFEFFKPHAFDVESLRVLIRRTSFLMFIVERHNVIVGYFFLRSFVHGVGYLGKMVDHDHQGRGIGKLMCKAAMDVATCLGLRMFESINKENMASMRSSGAVLKQVVLEELGHGDLLIEDFPLE